MRLANPLKLLLVLFAFMPGLALAWGETGHRVVCQIAFDELSDAAKTEIERLLNLDPDFENFADSCLFADTPERIRMFDHFMNVPRSFNAIATDECPLADTCVIPAIHNDAEILRNEASSDSDRLLALKLLGHWVGDIHQPMHISYKDDRGANHINVDIGMPDANLHGVWDYAIVARNLGDDYLQIAAELRAAVTECHRGVWQHDSPVEWANESYQITISPSVGYCTQKQGACWYSENNMLLKDGGPWREMAISDDYLLQHGSIVSKRLQQAGIRLAVLLERALQ